MDRRPPSGISVRFELSSSSAGWRVQLPRELLKGTTRSTSGSCSPKFEGTRSVGGSCAGQRLVAVRARCRRECANGRDDDGDGKIDAADRGCGGTSDDVEGDEPVTPRLLRASVTPAKARPGGSIARSRTCAAARDGQADLIRQVVCTMGTGSARASYRSDLGGGRLVQAHCTEGDARDDDPGNDDDRRSDAVAAVLVPSRPRRGRADPVEGRGGRPPTGR